MPNTKAKAGSSARPNKRLIGSILFVHATLPRRISSARPEAVDRLIKPRFVPYFLFRDPRDVVVSHVFYVTDMEARHVHHDYYASLPDFDSRLKVSILGRPELLDYRVSEYRGTLRAVSWLARPSRSDENSF